MTPVRKSCSKLRVWAIRCARAKWSALRRSCSASRAALAAEWLSSVVDSTNSTPICVAVRQVTRQLPTVAWSSTRSNEFGIPMGLSTLRQALPSARSRTVQSITAPRSLKTICAFLRTRWRRRTTFWRSCFGVSIVRFPGADTAVSFPRFKRLCWKAVTFCCSRMCDFYVVDWVSRHLARSPSVNRFACNCAKTHTGDGSWLDRMPRRTYEPRATALPRFPKRFEAHAIGRKGELYAELVFQLAVRHPFVLGIQTSRHWRHTGGRAIAWCRELERECIPGTIVGSAPPRGCGQWTSVRGFRGRRRRPAGAGAGWRSSAR